MQAAFEGNVVGDVRTGCLTLGSGGALAVCPKASTPLTILPA